MFTRDWYLIEEMIVDTGIGCHVCGLRFHYHYCVNFFLYSLKQSIIMQVFVGFLSLLNVSKACYFLFSLNCNVTEKLNGFRAFAVVLEAVLFDRLLGIYLKWLHHICTVPFGLQKWSNVSLSVLLCLLILFLTAAGLSKQVPFPRHSFPHAGRTGCGPDVDEGGAVAEAEQDRHLTATERPPTAHMGVQWQHGQEPASLHVPQAQLSCRTTAGWTWPDSAVCDFSKYRGILIPWCSNTYWLYSHACKCVTFILKLDLWRIHF